jgi:hypothetical protein
MWQPDTAVAARRTNNDDNFRLFCGMMEGLAFLPVPDLTNGIHLLRTLCPDDPPEAAELIDYFD